MFKTIQFILYIISFFVLNHLHAQYEAYENFDTESAGIVEHLKMLEEHPLDINRVAREDLMIFPFLSEAQIDTILLHQPYTTLQQISAFLGRETYQALSPFITLGKPQPAISGNMTSRISFTPETMRGYRENIYLGSKYYLYNRLRLAFGEHISSGLLSQKDAGEPSLTDHYSGFIQWQDRRFRLIAGAFSVHFGEGLALAHPWFSGRSGYPLAPLKSIKWGGKAALSGAENAGFSGIYGQIQPIQRVTISGFYSRSILDAVPGDNGSGVTSLVSDGYHRTETERLRKDLVAKTTSGGALIYQTPSGSRIGIAHARSSFTPDIRIDELKQELITVWHNQSHVSSLFNTIHLNKLILSGELALSSPGSLAQQYGLVINENHWSAGGKWWHVANTFSSPDGKSFLNSETFPQGIQGFYFGLSGRPVSGLAIDGYWQIEKQLWRSYFSSLPGQKKWYFLQLSWKYDRETEMGIHYRYARSNLSRHALRFQYNKTITRRISLRGRIEKVIESLQQKEGVNLYQDIKVQIIESLYLQGRYSSFQTADYDARIYEYENDLPGYYAMSALYGKGHKYYIILSWQPVKHLSLRLKYRRLYYEGAEYIGSGYAQIPGDTRQDLRFQFYFSF